MYAKQRAERIEGIQRKCLLCNLLKQLCVSISSTHSESRLLRRSGLSYSYGTHSTRAFAVRLMTTAMKFCRMCDSLRPLVRAHAIPEAFFREAKAGSRNLLIVGNTQGGAPRRRPIGVYDSEILCAECEGKFDKIDAYGTRVLLHEFDQLFAPVPNGGKIIAFESTQIDQEMLLRFFVAVLWRASVSTQDFYKSVNLGKFEELAAFAVTDPNAPVPFVFEALVFRWIAKSDLKMYAGSIQNPVRGRFGATNFYRLYLGMTMAVVRVSEQDLPVAMRPLRLCAQDQLFVPANDFESSTDFANMVSIVRSAPSWPSRAK